MSERDTRPIGVVGCGLMGSGIVEVAARSGHDVVYLEPTDDLLEAGARRIEASTSRAVERGKLLEAELDDLLGRLRGVTDVALLADASVVIEAATEDPTVKLDLFSRLDRALAPEAIIASNTSSIPIATLGAATSRPDRVVGMHFFNPPPVMQLVEITPSLETSDETIGRVRELAEGMGKTVVTASDRAGFIVNRLVVPYLCSAMSLYDEGSASLDDIDTAMQLGMNHPMGPLRLADFVGLDTVLAIADVLHAEFGDPAYAAPPVLRRLVEAGHTGRKSGRGFYRY